MNSHKIKKLNYILGKTQVLSIRLFIKVYKEYDLISQFYKDKFDPNFNTIFYLYPL